MIPQEYAPPFINFLLFVVIPAIVIIFTVRIISGMKKDRQNKNINKLLKNLYSNKDFNSTHSSDVRQKIATEKYSEITEGKGKNSDLVNIQKDYLFYVVNIVCENNGLYFYDVFNGEHWFAYNQLVNRYPHNFKIKPDELLKRKMSFNEIREYYSEELTSKLLEEATYIQERELLKSTSELFWFNLPSEVKDQISDAPTEKDKKDIMSQFNVTKYDIDDIYDAIADKFFMPLYSRKRYNLLIQSMSTTLAHEGRRL